MAAENGKKEKEAWHNHWAAKAAMVAGGGAVGAGVYHLIKKPSGMESLSGGGSFLKKGR